MDGHPNTLDTVLQRLRAGADIHDVDLRRRLDAAFGKYVDWLHGRCAFELRGVAAVDHEDIVQETLLVAWSKLPDYRGESRFRTWLVGILINLCRNARRKCRDALTEDGVIELESEAGSVLAGLLREERDNLVRAAAEACLDPTDQEIAEWRFVYEYGYEQIMEISGISEKKVVHAALERCKRRLRTEIEARLATMSALRT